MTATLTLAHRPNPVDVTDPATVRQIAEAVAAYNRGGGDRQFRLRQPPVGNVRQAVRFMASDVAALDADGINLVDLGSPFDTQAVAA